MDIKDLVQIEAKDGCVGCVAFTEMKRAVGKTGSCEGTLCERLGNACLRGTIWVKADGEKRIQINTAPPRIKRKVGAKC